MPHTIERPAAGPDGPWQLAVAALVSVLFALPLIANGTPDVESYVLSIFSTVAFARELVTGGDPWFAPAYGFGVPLPISTWLLAFPLAIPAALAGIDWLYALLWIGGEFVFAFYFLRLAMAFTGRRAISVILLLTAALSFSNLGTTYVDDWPDAFLGWALWPACLWYIGRLLVHDSPAGRVKSAAACAFALGMFTRTTHHNEMVTFFSCLAVMLAFLLPFRRKQVALAAGAVSIALLASLDVIVSAVSGVAAGTSRPLAASVASANDAPTLASYVSFLEPIWTVAGGQAAVTEPVYGRVPFFGLVTLVLAAMGAVRPFLSRSPFGAVPNDLARAVAVGFLACTALTLLPSWVVLNLPRMWTYRDGQTVLGLLCAAMAIAAMRGRFGRLLPPLLAAHLAQMILVAAPIVQGVVREEDPRLFGYAREAPVFFERLRATGIDEKSRLVLAGELEDIVRGSLAAAGVTAVTDFALEGIPVVNGWYRGARTPALGEASMEERYGSYETIISWKDLRHLDAAALDVLGITHVVVLEPDLPDVPFAGGLRRSGSFEVPGGRRVVVMSNDDAWGRATLLGPGAAALPPMRPGCPSRSVYCRDYSTYITNMRARLDADWRGSSARIALPPGHDGGRVFVSMNAGPGPDARVDGNERPVHVMLETFAAIDVGPGDAAVDLSLRWTGRMLLTLAGLALLAACLVVALAPGRALAPPVEVRQRQSRRGIRWSPRSSTPLETDP